jgi:hypothetical protein
VPGVEVPIIWTAAHGVESLGSLGGTLGVAVAASADGSVVVGQSALLPGSTDEHPFRWTRAGGLVDLGLPPGTTTGGPTAVSADGLVVCGSAGPTTTAFRWTAAGMQPLGGAFVNAMSISADGSAIACRAPFTGALWTLSQGLQPLPAPPGWPQGSPSWLSADGAVVYGTASDPGSMTNRAYRWTAASGYQFLPPYSPQPNTGAAMASADGSLVLGDASLQQIVWTPGTVQPGLDYLHGRGVDTTGWTFLRIRGFTPDLATFIGNGVSPTGRNTGWIVTIPPPCFANCDGSTAAPVLNVADFVCFGQRFAAGDPYANCDGSTMPPVLNVADFVCFQQRFAAGCP